MQLKLTLKRAYDTMRWETVEFALTGIGMPKKFSDWVKVRVVTPKFTIMIFEFSHGWFGSKRGIRQGDTMSPFLFVLVQSCFLTP